VSGRNKEVDSGEWIVQSLWNHFSSFHSPLTTHHYPLILSFLFLFNTASFAAEPAETRVIEAPRYEAEQVITGWLKHAGYETSTTSLDDSLVLTAVKNASRWEIALRHHSPVAAEISVVKGPQGGARELWKYLAAYLQGYSTNHSGPVSNSPAPVAGRMESVVCIKAVVGDRTIQITGFVVDTSGLILCTAHTLRKPTRITIIFPDGRTLAGHLLRADFDRDLALLECSHAFEKAIHLNKANPVPGMGQKVFSIGCPLNRAGTMSSGYVDGPPRLVDGQPLLQVRMEVEPGSSGSPVFDSDGNLVAVVKGRMKGDNLSGLLIPMETIISFVKER